MEFEEPILLLGMAPYYEYICSELQLSADQDLLSKMTDINTIEKEKLEEAVKDAEENLGEIEIRDAKIAKAEYLSKIGDKVMKEYCQVLYILQSLK